MLRILFILYICNTICLNVFSQDRLFSQFYNAPLTLNPAFTGCGKNSFRTCFSSKLQWMRLAKPLSSVNLSVDNYFPSVQASAGVIINQYSEGYINVFQPSVLLAKNLEFYNFNDCRELFFNFAFQVGPAFRYADRNRYLFPDQINQNGPTGQPTQAEVFTNLHKSYFDVSFGFILTSQNWMLGGTGYHLSKPNNGLIGDAEASVLPRRFNLHLSYIADGDNGTIQKQVFIKPTAILQIQGVSRQFSVGSLLYFREDTPFEFGVWYNNNLNLKDNHSISIGVILNLGKEKDPYNSESYNRFRTGAGYDFDINRPSNRYTGGSTQINLLYEKNFSDNGECPKPWGDCGARYPWVFH